MSMASKDSDIRSLLQQAMNKMNRVQQTNPSPVNPPGRLVIVHEIVLMS